MSRRTQWVNECVYHYVQNGVEDKYAEKCAQEHALSEESEHGSVVDLWEPADALVAHQMENWSMSV